MEALICQCGLCCHAISSRTVGTPNIQVPLHREANLACGSKWSWPIWPATSLVCEASHCLPRQPADGRETRPGAEKDSHWWSDNIIISVLLFIHDCKLQHLMRSSCSVIAVQWTVTAYVLLQNVSCLCEGMFHPNFTILQMRVQLFYKKNKRVTTAVFC